MTIKGNKTSGLVFECPSYLCTYVVDGFMYTGSLEFTASERTVEVVLYNGAGALIDSTSPEVTITNISTTGAAEVDEGFITITGDCTITIDYTTSNDTSGPK